MDILKLHTNSYGNVDISKRVPAGLSHVTGHDLRLCRSIGIPNVTAMCGFNKMRRRYFPILSGAVIAEKDLARLEQVRLAKAVGSEEKRTRLLKKIENRIQEGARAPASFAWTEFADLPLAELKDMAKELDTDYARRIKPWIDLVKAVERSQKRARNNVATRYRLLFSNRKSTKQRAPFGAPEPVTLNLRAELALFGPQKRELENEPDVNAVGRPLSRPREARRLELQDRAVPPGKAWAALSPERRSVVAVRSMLWHGPDSAFADFRHRMRAELSHVGTVVSGIVCRSGSGHAVFEIGERDLVKLGPLQPGNELVRWRLLLAA